jgi:predicted acylesterase/phospholipase RssA
MVSRTVRSAAGSSGNVRTNAWIVFAVAVLLAGCSAPTRNPVPIEKMAAVEIAGMPGVRAWGDEFSPQFQADVVQSIRDEHEADYPTVDGKRSYAALLISGGGDSGSFGAGFLEGWTEAGTRPKFKLVTGISVGALIAPFAFLGSDYDPQLKTAFTTINRHDIYKRRNVFKVLGSESVVKTDPLVELIAGFLDRDFLAAVAREHDRGRRLYVATTNLDAQRLVIWNMGLIARHADERALELFRRILLASASIPVAFPPVYFEVVVDGERYDEMHVDGGIINQFFFFGATLDLLEGARKATVYIIRNDEVGPAPEHIPRKMTRIASRSVDTLIKATAIGDLFRVYSIARLGSIDVKYVGIPEDFKKDSEDLFDTEDMRRLFEIGRELALEDDPWRTTLPGFEAPEADPEDAGP